MSKFKMFKPDLADKQTDQHTPFRVLFIINPVSGMRHQKKVIKQIEGIYDYRLTQYAGHLKEIVCDNFSNYDLFVAVGGDGTFNELVGVLAGTEKVAAILPFGSGNGFAREFGFRKTVAKLNEYILKGESLLVDTINIGGFICANVSGVGLDGQVAHVFHRMKRRGFWSYFFSVIKILIFVKPFRVSIKGNDFMLEGRFLLVSIANTRQYGNNAIISPQGSPFDGKFDIMMFKPTPLILFPYFAVKIFVGSLRKSAFVEYLRGIEEVELNTNNNKFHIDGEAVKINSPVKIRIVPRSLRVLKTDKFR
jgi:diacylglycerol kinase (ATP)